MIKKSEKQIEREHLTKAVFIGLVLGLIISTTLIFLGKNIFASISAFFGIPLLFFLFFYFKNYLNKTTKIKKMETVFPDFLQLVSSNLRAGITIDRAMILSVRKEFDPLDKEIEKTGKDITTGKDIDTALLEMSKRIGSERIKRTVLIILSGFRAGGNIATLLEETSVNMRERGFVEKRAASNVLMYVIFIFLAVSVGAPALFSLSTILVEILTTLLSGLPEVSTSEMAFTLQKINISPTFIIYFALVFMIVTDVLASLIIGLVSKGDEKDGFRYTIPLITISIVVFFLIRLILGNYMSALF
ncbi:hypothetical protein GF386_00325 [Candidatus Pacearchaeota archaeon]|nr:hypothetical protein [Candidatus Pacearchaeota archaeon]MBD3282728.1 hypothetical protein [Candidatus Pacearchaeota archaeon]